jgi:hypothetical protein
MRRLLLVSVGIAVVHCLVLSAAPARAADGVVLVGCDLFGDDGPRVTFVQSHGVSRISAGSSKKRRGFVSGSSFSSAAFEGRDCADVLSDAVDADLVFQAMNVFGQDAEFGIWFFRED